MLVEVAGVVGEDPSSGYGLTPGIGPHLHKCWPQRYGRSALLSRCSIGVRDERVARCGVAAEKTAGHGRALAEGGRPERRGLSGGAGVTVAAALALGAAMQHGDGPCRSSSRAHVGVPFAACPGKTSVRRRKKRSWPLLMRPRSFGGRRPYPQAAMGRFRAWGAG